MTNEQFIVRQGKADDWVEVGRAIGKLQDFERELVGYPIKPGEEVCQSYISELRTELNRNRGVLLIAETNDQFIGFLTGYVEQAGDILVAPEFDRSAYISDIFVHPNSRRLGVARTLICEFEERMGQLGLTWATISVKSRNIQALNTYLDSGFEEYEIILAKKIS